jgi:hypothetical protein
MVSNQKVQCDSKQNLFLADEIELDDGTIVRVYLLINKKSVKQYCKDTELPFADGLKRLGIENCF